MPGRLKEAYSFNLAPDSSGIPRILAEIYLPAGRWREQGLKDACCDALKIFTK